MTDPIINREFQPKIEQQVLTLQIISGALIAGVTVFAVVVLAKQPDNIVGQPFISYVAATFACGAIVMSIVVPSIVGPNLIHQTLANTPRNAANPDCSDLVPAFQTRLIIGLALLEGGAFFCLTAYMLERQWWTLGAAGVLCLLMLLRFPTRGRVEDWCRVQYENASIEQ